MNRLLLNLIHVHSGCFVFMCGSDFLALVKLMHFVSNIYYCFFMLTLFCGATNDRSTVSSTKQRFIVM